MLHRTPQILVVEDDRETRALIARYLCGHSLTVATVADGREMDRFLSNDHADLIVLDVMLPGEDGLSVCRRLREGSNIPVIILTARGEDIDRILGLELGADDYLVKPFNPRELLARINAVLRRHATLGSDASRGPQRLRFLGWVIDFRLRELRNPLGAQVALTSAEFDLLRAFCERPGRILSRDNLLNLIHGRAAGPFERSIDVLVSRLRRKLNSGPDDASIIKTIRTGGYLFTPHVDQR